MCPFVITIICPMLNSIRIPAPNLAINHPLYASSDPTPAYLQYLFNLLQVCAQVQAVKQRKNSLNRAGCGQFPRPLASRLYAAALGGCSVAAGLGKYLKGH